MTFGEISVEITEIAGFCALWYNKENGTELSERLTNLNVYLARSAVLQGEAQYIFDLSFAKETEELLKLNLSPSVLTNLAKSKCALEGKLLKLVERMNRTITHQIDAIRSQLSYLKSFND